MCKFGAVSVGVFKSRFLDLGSADPWGSRRGSERVPENKKKFEVIGLNNIFISSGTVFFSNSPNIDTSVYYVH